MTSPTDLLCFSHLRWGFVFQRPNHLISRAARLRRTFFFEEPMFDATGPARLETREVEASLFVCTPHVRPALQGKRLLRTQRSLLDQLLRERQISLEVLWFYTPMALPLAEGLRPRAVVYDCMDELSAFSGAPAELPELEEQLFRRADVVFTGGHKLYEAKRQKHPRVYPFPSSVDAAHFGKARNGAREPADQAALPGPRIGYFGVIDERIDLELIRQVADDRRAWQWVLLGPVAKIDPTSLPQRDNIHWLGRKEYTSLPDYVSGWDVAVMPFALNESTRFISPTKTLEYMAAGKPVVSTAIGDVVEPYGAAGAVRIADRETFADAIGAAMAHDPSDVRRISDHWVGRTSWDRTWQQMEEILAGILRTRTGFMERTQESCSTT